MDVGDEDDAWLSVTSVDELERILDDTLKRERSVDQRILDLVYPQRDTSIPEGEACSPEHLGEDFYSLNVLPKLGEFRRTVGTELRRGKEFLKLVGEQLQHTSATASRVSTQVRAFERTKERLKASLRVTQAMIDVNGSINLIKNALRDGDFTTAAEHVRRSKDAIATEGLALDVEDGRVIAEAEKRLKELTVTNFDRALEKNDEVAIVESYCVFAALGMGEDGLRRYIVFLRGRIKTHHDDEMLEVDDNSKNTPHVQMMSRLLNFSSELMQSAKSTAENCILGNTSAKNGQPANIGLSSQFGTIISELNKECDFFASKIVTRFVNDKQLVELIAKLRAGEEKEGYDESGMAIPLTAEADFTLNQCAMMAQHCENYFRWLIEQGKHVAHGDFDSRPNGDDSQEGPPLGSDKDEDSDGDLDGDVNVDDEEEPGNIRAGDGEEVSAVTGGPAPYPDFGLTRAHLRRTKLATALQELSALYIQLEAELMQQSCDAAFDRDEVVLPSAFYRDENGVFRKDGEGAQMQQDTCATSALEETFFLLQNSAMRALATGVVDSYCAVINFGGNVLTASLIEGYGSKVANITDSGKEHTKGDDSTYGLKNAGMKMLEDADSCVVVLNNMHAAAQYTTRLVNRLKEEGRAVFFEDGDQDKIAGCLEMLQSCGVHCKQLLDAGLAKLVSMHRLRLRGVMDALNGAGSVVRYDLTDEEYDQLMITDPFRSEIVERLSVIVDPYRVGFTKRNFEYMLHHAIETVSQRVEGSLARKSFTHLGGLKFEQDVRSLIVFFSERSTRNVRKRFARLTEMALLLSVENLQDVREYMDDKTVHVLPNEGVVKTLSYRSDFGDQETIKQVLLR